MLVGSLSVAGHSLYKRLDITQVLEVCCKLVWTPAMGKGNVRPIFVFLIIFTVNALGVHTHCVKYRIRCYESVYIT